MSGFAVGDLVQRTDYDTNLVPAGWTGEVVAVNGELSPYVEVEWDHVVGGEIAGFDLLQIYGGTVVSRCLELAEPTDAWLDDLELA